MATESEKVIRFREQPGKVMVLIDGQPFATYVYRDDKIPRPYFAHVRTPDGIQVTRNHPPIDGEDHTDHATMHPGIWMAFGDLNGTDFWRNRGRVVHERFIQEPTGGVGEGMFAVRNRYETADGETICHELCRFTFRVHASGYLLFWDSAFSADEAIYFTDQEEMGLGVRLATPIAVASGRGGRIIDSEGRTNEAQIWGESAPWCDYSGPIEGNFAGITIMPDPDNFRPCSWHARDYGFMAANPFGRAAFEAGPPSKVIVSPDRPLRLCFGVFVHAGAAAEDVDLEAAYADYLGSRRDTRSLSDIRHVTVRREPGQFLGWPANGGIWNWGDEILVMYTHGLFKQDARGMHAIDRETPWTIDTSRSLDGGLTWTHQTDVIPNPRYEDVCDAPQLTEPIDFSDPDTILKFQFTHHAEGRTYLFYSTDRGRSWRGPYRLPTFGMEVVAARNDYLVDDADTCTAFWSMSRSTGERDTMVYPVRSNDGGLTWELGTRIGRETQGSKIDYAIMPSTVRTGPDELVTCIRNRIGRDDCFIDCWASSDNGSTWSQVSRPVGNEAGTTPPMLNRLASGDLVLTYGYRKPPQGVHAKISRDAGRTWGPKITLRHDAGTNDDIGYTRSVVRADGKIVTVYYYNLAADQERFIAATIWDASLGE